MIPGEHLSLQCAITCDAVFNSTDSRLTSEEFQEESPYDGIPGLLKT